MGVRRVQKFACDGEYGRHVNRRRFITLAGGVSVWPAGALAQLTQVAAIAGDRFEEAGISYRLADVIAPSAYMFDTDAEPYFESSRAMLDQLLSQNLWRYDVAGPVTRWGEKLVRPRRVKDNAALPFLLAQAGAVRIAPETDDHDFINALLAAEDRARRAGAGLWAHPAYRVYDSNDASGAIGGYHLITGEAQRAAKTRSRVYINFGNDYNTDFTVSAANSDWRRWSLARMDVATLAGARLRVRGFVRQLNGPATEVTHEQQIEFL